MKHILMLVALFVVSMPQLALADSVLRIGDNVSVSDEQMVEGNYYAATRPFARMDMSGQVAGDLYVAGGTVTINGAIEEDLFIVSGVSNVHATVTDDVRIVAGEVTVSEYIGGDLFVIGGTLNVLSSAQIDGTVFFFGGNGEIAGVVEQSIVGYAEKLKIDGTVGGGVDVTAPAGLQLGSNADIAESVRYKSFVEITRDPASVIGGDVTKVASAAASTKETARAVLTPLFMILFTALSLYLFFQRHLYTIFTTALQRPVRSLLIGTGVIFASPIVSIMLFLTVLGALVGALVLLSTTILALTGMVLAGSLLGSSLWYWYRHDIQVSLFTIIGGTSLLYMILLLPMLGIVVYVLLIAQVIGALGLRLYNKIV